MNLGTESGNMTFLPMRFSPALGKYERYEEFKNFKSKLFYKIYPFRTFKNKYSSGKCLNLELQK